MRIAVMGAGGVGGYFGGRLAQAGHEVAFVARGRHLEAIKAQDLRPKSPLGDATIKVKAAENPAELGAAEVVLFAVKLWDFVDCLPAEMRASMAADLEAGGRLEAPWLSGAVARMSREAGLEASANRAVFAALKPHVEGR